MPTLQANIARMEKAIAELKAHCMVVSITEDESHIFVRFPPGYPWDGVRVTKANGRAWAYEQALARAEKTWIASFP